MRCGFVKPAQVWILTCVHALMIITFITNHNPGAWSAGGRCGTWASLFGGVKLQSFVLQGQDAGCRAPGTVATGSLPNIIGAVEATVTYSSNNAAASAILSPLDPSSGVLQLSSAPVTRIVAASQGIYGQVKVLPGDAKLNKADRLKFTARPGAQGVDFIQFTVQAADMQQATGMAVVFVNQSK